MFTTTSAFLEWVSTKATTPIVLDCLPPSSQEGEDGDLNVGCSLIYADVEHRGSKMTKNVRLEHLVHHLARRNQVDSGVHERVYGWHRHALLLRPSWWSIPNRSACIQETLVPGQYTIDMVLVMNDKPSTDTDPASSGGTDQRTSNNEMTMVANIVNNLPTITSFELTTEGDIVVGQESPLIFVVSAFDVDDPSGMVSTSPTPSLAVKSPVVPGPLPKVSPCVNPSCLQSSLATRPVPLSSPTNTLGEVSLRRSTMFVWNSAVATATSDAGIGMQYALSYNGQSEFTISEFVDADAASYDAVQLEGFTGTYGAVAALDYTPSDLHG